MKIERSDGLTPSEKYLKKLCDHAFLSLWSYSGIYRDQKQGAKGDGKELCDLLVVFENHIIIFSDKYIEFPDSGNIRLDWSRWYRRAVEDSAKQIFGAERWIKSFPNRLFIDRECTQPFPIQLPNLSETKFHRIVIAHGMAKKCKEYFKGGSGSLIIDNSIFGDNHTGAVCEPFSIGQVDERKGYVHVFDEITLDMILQQLDTVTDFTNYLNKKEKFLSHQMVRIPGEEELLAFYLQKLDEDNEHNFFSPIENITWTISEGFWENFLNSLERKSQLIADKISYSWDAIIETFNKHILEDTQHYAYPSGIVNQEKTVKFLARESRTRRRMLAKSLYEMLAKTSPSEFAVRVVGPSYKNDPYYVFLLLPREKGISENAYREMRRDLLQGYCIAAKQKFPDAEDIVGFATESGRGEYGSEDLIYLDTKEWDEENQKLADYYHNEVGLLKVVNLSKGKEYEFPTQLRKKKKIRKRSRSNKN